MGKSIDRSIVDSFAKDNNQDNVKAYLDWLLATMNQYASQIRRTTILALVLMAAFEIVSESGTTITISSFQIQKGSLVDTFIPALVAYLFLQLISDTNRVLTLDAIFSRAFYKWNNERELNDLDVFIMSPFPLMWGASMASPKNNAGYYQKAQRLAVKWIDWIAPFIGLFFEGQAYYTLFKQPVFPYLAWFFSAIISFICVSFAIIAYRE